MNKEIIRSIYARCSRKRFHWLSDEKGQALPIVLATLALGIMVVAPFLNHASSSLISAQNFQHMADEEYSADAGIEEAIWKLTYDDLASQMPRKHDQVSYTLGGEINNLQPAITVTRLSDTFQIDSLAGSTTISAEVTLAEGAVTIDSWQVAK